VIPSTELLRGRSAAWDSFSTRKIGMKVNQRMARKFGGSSERIRGASSNWLARVLAVQRDSFGRLERASFENFAMVLALVPDLVSWSQPEKQALLEIIRAKPAPNETRYLHLTKKHPRLRKVLLRLGA